MKTLAIILDSKFPFEPPSEQFLHNEFTSITQKFNDIKIFATARQIDTTKCADLTLFPGNIQYQRIKRLPEWLECVIGFFGNVLFNRHFYHDFFHIIKNKELRHISIIAKTSSFYVQSYAYFFELKRYLKKIPFHNYHVISIYSYWLNPLVGTNCFVKKFVERVGKDCRVISSSRSHVYGDMNIGNGDIAYRPAVSVVNKLIDNVIPISQNEYDFLASCGITLSKMSVSRLGVHDCGFSIASTPQNHPKFSIVSCSTLKPYKRVWRIVEALSQINDIPIKWTHFGSSDDTAYEVLKQRCKELLPPNIDWTLAGTVTNSVILEKYKSEFPDLFLNVSNMEGIPVSIMEAFSCGIPAIATRVGGNCEIIDHGCNGFLLDINYHDKELVHFILEIVNYSDQKRIEMKKCAYLTWSLKYNAEKNYNEFTNLISGNS